MGLLNNSIQNSTLDCPIYTKDSEFWMEFINFWVGGVMQTLFIIFGFLGKFVTEHTLFENYFKCLIYSFLAFPIKFCPIQIDLSGTTIWPQASG